MLYACKSNKQNEVILKSIEKNLQEGYIVFRKGSSLISNTVMAADKCGTYSHCGKEDLAGMTFHAVEEVISEDGTVATVKLESTDKNGKIDTEDVTLKKDEKGNWRVVLNK